MCVPRVPALPARGPARPSLCAGLCAAKLRSNPDCNQSVSAGFSCCCRTTCVLTVYLCSFPCRALLCQQKEVLYPRSSYGSSEEWRKHCAVFYVAVLNVFGSTLGYERGGRSVLGKGGIWFL